MKGKGIPKYQREEVHHQCGSTALLTNTCSHTLFFSPSMPRGSILNTKDLKHPFDHCMHFQHSALFCLYSQAGEVGIHPTVSDVLPVVSDAFCTLPSDTRFTCTPSSPRLVCAAFGSSPWFAAMEVTLCDWLEEDACSH